jgi:hypothetical protein
MLAISTEWLNQVIPVVMKLRLIGKKAPPTRQGKALHAGLARGFNGALNGQ